MECDSIFVSSLLLWGVFFFWWWFWFFLFSLYRLNGNTRTDMCWNIILFAAFWGHPGLGVFFEVEMEHQFFQGIPTGWRRFERRARARQVYVMGRGPE